MASLQWTRCDTPACTTGHVGHIQGRKVFWGPMAIAIMGGLVSATVLTLCFVPALYAAAARVERTPPVLVAEPVLHPAE